MAKERTFALIKPEGMCQPTYSVIIEAIGSHFHIAASKCLIPSWNLVQEHYCQHQGKDYFPSLVGDIANRKVLAMVLEGDGAISLWRKVMGPFREDERCLPEHAQTIRGLLMKPGDPLRRNFVHGSDSEESAAREIALWFPGPQR